ncbi:MAG: RagB/SusD family nutrient uptake outer membrane protein [Agriterribacter sp.]
MNIPNNYRYNILVLAAIFILAGSSCRKQLDKSSLTDFSSTTFWTSETNAMLALTGVYRGEIQMISGRAEFAATDWWSYYGLLFTEFATDNAYDRRGDNSVFNTLTNGKLTSSNVLLSQYWQASYKRIARCNYFIENVSKAPMSADRLERVQAEARFIRAAQYFYMSQYWGSVPLVTKTLSLEEANTVTKASRADIVKFVKDELTAVAAILPQQKNLAASEAGRATRQVALAFLGRLQLAEKDYTAAAATFKSIMDLGDNTIDPSYESLFDGTNEASNEIIFSSRFIKNTAANAVTQHTMPRVLGGWHLHNPLGSLVESFDFKDGTAFSYSNPQYNAANVGENRDPRLAYTVLYNGQAFKGLVYNTNPDDANAQDKLTSGALQSTRTGFCIKKFNSGYAGDLANTDIDLPIIRYAEILLSYLEAKLEAGDAIDQALLDQTINAVRGRASVNMPPVTATNAGALRPILRKERRNELALEGIRYWDLLRWGIAGDVLKGDFFGASYPGSAAVATRNAATKTDPLNQSRWYVTSKAFRIGTDEYWPIPQGEQDINPNLR